MAQVQFQKVDSPHHGVMVTGVADLDEDKENEGDKKKK